MLTPSFVLASLIDRALHLVQSFPSFQAQGTPGAPAPSGAPNPPSTPGPFFQLPAGTPKPVVDAWEALHAYPLLAALVITVVGYIAARLTQVILNRGVKRVTSATRTQVDDQLLALAQKPVFLTVFLGSLSLATTSLGLPGAFAERTVDVLLTFLVLAWLGALLPASRLVLDALGRNHDRFPLIEQRTIPLFDILSKVILIGGGGFALFEVWGVNPAPWFASAGVIGIAVGFAARDTLANLFAGIFIIADGPYKLGDFITLDSGERGLVTHVGIRSTRLLTRDDIEITLPNSVIANAKILNESGGRWEKERIRIKVGTAYGSDIDQVMELLVKLATEHDHICPTPTPRVRLRGFGDSSLDFELLAWIDEPVLRGRLSSELYVEIYKAFARENIEIPFPQRDVWVRRVAQTDPPADAD
ncbi:MAG: mechanosensitive ion channel family protein [Acidobacteriota bacterium]